MEEGEYIDEEGEVVEGAGGEGGEVEDEEILELGMEEDTEEEET